MFFSYFQLTASASTNNASQFCRHQPSNSTSRNSFTDLTAARGNSVEAEEVAGSAHEVYQETALRHLLPSQVETVDRYKRVQGSYFDIVVLKLLSLYQILVSIVVSIPACHAGDQGSIP